MGGLIDRRRGLVLVLVLLISLLLVAVVVVVLVLVLVLASLLTIHIPKYDGHRLNRHTQLVSNSAPTWSSSLGVGLPLVIFNSANHQELIQLEMNQIRNEPN